MTQEEVFKKHFDDSEQEENFLTLRTKSNLKDEVVAAIATAYSEGAAAERARLIEEATGEVKRYAISSEESNTDGGTEVRVYQHWDGQFVKHEDMRSRCAALLLKEREKALRFAEWATEEYIFYEPYNAWLTASGDRLTTSQLYDLFESQRKKGDSERKVDNQNEEG